MTSPSTPPSTRPSNMSFRTLTIYIYRERAYQNIMLYLPYHFLKIWEETNIECEGS